MNRLTMKSQEALQDAQTKALRFGHTEVDGEHLLLALLEQSDGLVPRLLVRVGADPDKLVAALEEDLKRRPRTTGPGASSCFFSAACNFSFSLFSSCSCRAPSCFAIASMSASFFLVSRDPGFF